jgi:hypothetical protein
LLIALTSAPDTALIVGSDLCGPLGASAPDPGAPLAVEPSDPTAPLSASAPDRAGARGASAPDAEAPLTARSSDAGAPIALVLAAGTSRAKSASALGTAPAVSGPALGTPPAVPGPAPGTALPVSEPALGTPIAVPEAGPPLAAFGSSAGFSTLWAGGSDGAAIGRRAERLVSSIPSGRFSVDRPGTRVWTALLAGGSDSPGGGAVDQSAARSERGGPFLPMPNARSKRLKNPGLGPDRVMGLSGHRGLVERCALASLQRLLDLSIEAWVVDSPPGWSSRWTNSTDLLIRSATHDSIPSFVVHQHRAGPVAGRPRACLGWDYRPPSGLRAGTPDRRGKRGEVAAIFAIITTEPTWSIGEAGLGTTSRTSPPSIAAALPTRRNSSSPGSPLGTRSSPPTLSSGRPSSATTGRGPKARAVATSNRSLPASRPKSSRRACITLTFSMWSSAATDATQSSRRRCASTRVKEACGNATAIGSPGKPAPEPRSAQRSPGLG